MDLSLFLPVLFPIYFVAFVAACLVWPMIRLYQKTGRFGLILQPAHRPVERMAGASIGVVTLTAGLWTALYPILGPTALDVWQTPGWTQWLGLVLSGLGVALMLVAQWQMGTSWRIGIDTEKTALITHGLYGVVRSPIYTAVLLALGGVALMSPSPWTICGLIGSIWVMMLQARLEEQHLIGLYGEQYLRYGARTGRFLPGIGSL